MNSIVPLLVLMSPRIQGLLLAVLLLVLPWDALSYVTMKKEMTSAQSDAFKAMEPMLLDLGLAIVKDGEKIVRVVKPRMMMSAACCYASRLVNLMSGHLLCNVFSSRRYCGQCSWRRTW